MDNCQQCFAPLRGARVCPHCGYDSSTAKAYVGVLPAFTILHNRYLLGRVLGKGGFGVTYVAMDLKYNTLCAIKEYLPAEYSTRSNGTKNIVPYSDAKAQYVFNHGREKFVEEAKTLLELKNDPIVVDILNFFQENNTAYLVMEYLDGQDLRKMTRMQGGRLDAGFAKTVFVTVASSLMEIHKKNILHRDLSPENIVVTKDGKIKLIDFGAARNFVSTQNAGMSILLKPGFAPPEQYEKKGNQGPWSDVYALCATFYNLVSGKTLVDALFRYRGQEQPSLISLGCAVTKKTSDVIEKGMALEQRNRYQNFMELLNDIDIEVSQKPISSPTPQPVKPPQPVRPPQPVKPSQPIRPPQPPVKTVHKHAYIAAVMRNQMVNKVLVPQGSPFSVGRFEQSHYRIAGDTNVSREHCQIRYDGTKLYITDKSANGTFFAKTGERLNRNHEYVVPSGTQFYLATPNHLLILVIE